MKAINLENIKSLELNGDILNRFNISMEYSTSTEIAVNVTTRNLMFGKEKQSDTRTVKAFDTVTNKLAFTFETNLYGTLLIEEVERKILEYIINCSELENYACGLVDVVVLQADGCYHTETNTIVVTVKDGLSDIKEIIYTPDYQVEAKTESGEFIEICKDDFVDIGMIEPKSI